MIESIIYWNIRSVNTQNAFERLLDLNRRHHFSYISYRRRIGLRNALVNCSSKIWIFWHEDCALEELKFTWSKYTWWNGRIGEACIFKRLDRIMGNQKFLNLEEEYWKHKSGLSWFKEGDRNTKFFHSYVKGRRRRMNLDEIHTDQGDIINGTQSIREEAVKVFKKQFTEERGDRDYSMLENIPSLIT
ncbi:hypothetical protein R3W88_024177 [Solanum pinnatisectum]|uniref:Uncharacterized protein n=1 Tax=Solanum pinnatisectum TaxID=50273 RepID=A0AAV9M1S6_9SOLN|nr:hypothetical protein R3W88_024177 [Solanum pinnatisectum]